MYILDKNIIEKLNKLYETKIIPNIIFHGGNLTVKKSILEYLINLINKLKKIYTNMY